MGRGDIPANGSMLKMGEFRTTRGEEPPPTRRESNWRRLYLLAGGGVILCLVVGLGFVIKVPRRVVASGYVTTQEYAEVRPPASGMVAAILVKTGDTVKKGDLLVQLESTEEKARLEAARNQVDKAEAEIARRSLEIAEEKRVLTESVSLARLRLSYASNRLERTRELLAKGLAAGSALEDEQLKEDLARAELQSLLSKNPGIYERELNVLRRELDVRRDDVRQAGGALRLREVRAPVDGQVVRYEFVIGELVRPETVLLEVFGGGRQVLKLRIRERDAAKVTVGAAYEALLTPYHTLIRTWFTGQVEFLRDVIQTEGVTSYRVAYCSFNPGSFSVPPGTTAEARIACGRTPFWIFLFGLE